MSLHRPWSHEGSLHHDGECFELNPVTWYVLATYGVTVRGPSTDDQIVGLDHGRHPWMVDDTVHGRQEAMAD